MSGDFAAFSEGMRIQRQGSHVIAYLNLIVNTTASPQEAAQFLLKCFPNLTSEEAIETVDGLLGDVQVYLQAVASQIELLKKENVWPQ